MTKFERLSAVFDDFHSQMIVETDELLIHLRVGWVSAKRDHEQMLSARTVTKSAIAQGLEQGLRELPLAFQKLPPEKRALANRALSSSVHRHAPDMLIKDQERLSKVLARGKIRTEAEYHLIRHQIDALEGIPENSSTLAKLYELEGKFHG